MNVVLHPDSNGSVIANLLVKTILLEQVKEAQKVDEKPVTLTREVQNWKKFYFTFTKNCVLLYQNSLCPK